MKVKVTRTKGNRFKLTKGTGKNAKQVKWPDKKTFRRRADAEIVAYWLRRAGR